MPSNWDIVAAKYGKGLRGHDLNLLTGGCRNCPATFENFLDNVAPIKCPATSRYHGLWRAIAKALHIHIWALCPYSSSKGHVHLMCRCGAGKRVRL